MTVAVTVSALVVNIEVSLEKWAEIRSCCSDMVPVEVSYDVYCSVLSRDQTAYQNLLLYNAASENRGPTLAALPLRFRIARFLLLLH